ncbi:hypothetical protein U1Q18_052395 [Sarracenia purpurea var. burkii]
MDLDLLLILISGKEIRRQRIEAQEGAYFISKHKFTTFHSSSAARDAAIIMGIIQRKRHLLVEDLFPDLWSDLFRISGRIRVADLYPVSSSGRFRSGVSRLGLAPWSLQTLHF